MSITLQSMSIEELRSIADSYQADEVLALAGDMGQPPRFVAKRSLNQIEMGKPATWCSPFRIVDDSNETVTGSCGFKDVPLEGRVEIGYGVSSIYRKRGIATAAVRALLNLAFVSESVTEVVARIDPANEASIRVVQKIGFEEGDMVVDAEGDNLVEWCFCKDSTGKP
jgi:ribosomal-protein-alanine N-acetyltransferase